MKLFLKTGCIILALFLLFTLFITEAGPGISITTSASSKKSPIYSVDTDLPRLGLTFDVNGTSDDMDKILSILEDHQVHATFFLTGAWVEEYPEAVKKIAQEGHDLGNRSESYKDMSFLSANECQQELISLHERVETLTHMKMTFFRPPYGAFSNNLITTAEELGYTTVLWNLDALDWKDYGSDAIIQTLTNPNTLHKGSIMRLQSGSTYTAEALDVLLTRLSEMGYECLPLSQLISSM